MKFKFALLIAFVLSSVPTIFAQQSTTSDEGAIREVVNFYFDGTKNNNVVSLKKAFDPRAKWFIPGGRDGVLTEIEIKTVFAAYAKNARDDERYKTKKPNIITRILSSDITAGTATVKVEFEYPDAKLGSFPTQIAPGITQTEYLSLIKFKDGWKIVSKVFTLQKTNPDLARNN